MSSDRFLLWGIDGQLTGSEHLLQMRLPLFTRDGDDAVYVARRVDWSTSLSESDVERVSVGRAEEYGDALDILEELPIAPGELVLIVGPGLRENLADIDLKPDLGSLTSNGFGVTTMISGAAESLANALEEYARQRFDRELACGFVTPAARAALGVMRNVGVGDLRGHLIRTLAMHRLDDDTDQYRRVLRLAHVRLRDETDVLENEVSHHIGLTRKLNYGRDIWFGVDGKGLNIIKGPRVPFHGSDLVEVWKSIYNATKPVLGKKLVNPKVFYPGVNIDGVTVRIPFVREDDDDDDDVNILREDR